MTYGIYTNTGMEGFISSEIPTRVVYAKGVGTSTRKGVWGTRSTNYDTDDYGKWMVAITLDKFFARTMSYDNSYGAIVSNDLQLLVGTNTGSRASVAGRLGSSTSFYGPGGGSIRWSETETTITIWVLVEGSSETSWMSNVNNTKTHEVWAMIVGTLPDNEEQERSTYGVETYDASGRITFNSFYEPVVVDAYAEVGTVPSLTNQLTSFVSTGTSGTMLIPTQQATGNVGVSRSHVNKIYYRNFGTCLSADGQRIGARASSWSGSTIEQTITSRNFQTGEYTKIPLVSKDRYFD